MGGRKRIEGHDIQQTRNMTEIVEIKFDTYSAYFLKTKKGSKYLLFFRFAVLHSCKHVVGSSVTRCNTTWSRVHPKWGTASRTRDPLDKHTKK